MEDEHTGDGTTRRYDASQPIGDVLSITEDGVEQTFEGASPRWVIDKDQQRFELATGETDTTDGDTIKFAFVSDEALVITADDARPSPISASRSPAATMTTRSITSLSPA